MSVYIGNTRKCDGRGDIISDGLILNLDASFQSSFHLGSRVWRDLSGNNFNATLFGTNDSLVDIPVFKYENCGVVEFDGNYANLPGNTTLYSFNFTWQFWHYYYDDTDNLGGLLWSESGVTNFWTAYGNVGGGVYARIDTTNGVYAPFLNGTLYNGGFDVSLLNRWEFTTIVKDNNVFSWYWGDVLKWQVVINDWDIPNVNQDIAIAANGNDNGNSIYRSFMKLANLRMYDRAFSLGEITDNYNARKSVFGL